MISQSEALDIAESELRSDPKREEAYQVGQIFSGAELGSRELNIYAPTPIDWNNCWVVYLERSKLPIAIESSTVIVIAIDTGKVLYVGSANDEG